VIPKEEKATLSTIRINTDVRIRPGRPGDLELLGLWNDAIDRVVAPTLRRQESGEALVLLALIEPWPMGHLLVDFTAHAADGASHLWHMGVHDALRRRGIGTELIATAERASVMRGLSAALIEVEKDNPDALRLYQRLGYLVIGEQDDVWPEPDANGELHDVMHPCWRMRKELAAVRE
jgi:ribosomal protein S18 acetylase RimI-like enzyme